MTFTEAAIEVLRLAGKPLHYKKITEISIQKNLLSHVGKTPEITMSSRLATMVRKDRGEAAIVKVKPGVFGLREFDENTLKAAEKASGHDFELPQTEVAVEAPAAEEAPAETAAEQVAPETAEVVEERKLPGADVFPEEDDDDVPILSAIASDDDSDEDGEGKQGGRGRKRRRRRKRRGEGESAPAESGRRGGRDSSNQSSRDSSSQSGRGGGRSEGSRRGRETAQVAPLEGDWDRTSEDGDLSGLELADAIAGVLGGRSRRARALADVARELVNRGRMSGSPEALAPTLAAAVRGDSARRKQAGERSRFRLDGGSLSLDDWNMPQEASRMEAEAIRVATRQRQAMRRALLKEFEQLPAASALELLATWLNAEGVVSLRAVRRPGSGSGEFHLAGTLRRGPMSAPVAIVFRRDGAPLTREQVVEVRGSLHHYGDATAAWLVSLGGARSGARDESAITGAAPVALYDGEALALAMEALGIGLNRHVVPMLTLDQDLFDALRGPSRRAQRAAPRAAQEETPSEAAAEDGSAEAATTKTAETDAEGEETEPKRPRRRRRRKRAGETAEAAANGETTEAAANGETTEAAANGETAEAAANGETAEEPSSDTDESGTPATAATDAVAAPDASASESADSPAEPEAPTPDAPEASSDEPAPDDDDLLVAAEPEDAEAAEDVAPEDVSADSETLVAAVES